MVAAAAAEAAAAASFSCAPPPPISPPRYVASATSSYSPTLSPVDYLKSAQAAAAAHGGALRIELLPREKGDENKPAVEALIDVVKAAGVR